MALNWREKKKEFMIEAKILIEAQGFTQFLDSLKSKLGRKCCI